MYCNEFGLGGYGYGGFGFGGIAIDDRFFTHPWTGDLFHISIWAARGSFKSGGF
ncbi:hypothetical protein [Caproicibacter fermentans]|uniref:hypothetical protein n=1 Tax=Caproicibacter fermentans TaxID=2576756 RepID=UPI001F3E2F80|nr:hypothetical protein [Caproicibacter fermentans]